MKTLATFVLSFLTVCASASHIVGGEFEIVHLKDYQYRINLIMYFDEVNGLQGNKVQDRFIVAKIFRNADGGFIRDVELGMINITPVTYTQSKCAIPALETSKLFYSTDIILDADTYHDPKGYYIVWERCCRNYTITNIVSKNPNEFPGEAAGQTFFLEFPPVIKNGVQFINSSPQLVYPFSDYACVNRLFYTDFGGIDPDGDSLVYSVVTPFSTHSPDAYPPINPKPYPEVMWRDSYSLQNVFGADPDLVINKNGLATVRPKYITGLFALAIKCEEYRDGLKIGEVRRDYQVLVIDCEEDIPPSIYAITPSGVYTDKPLDVFFDDTAEDSMRCITVHVEDQDVYRLGNPQENVSIKTIPIGFNKDISSFLPVISTASLSPTSPSINFEICFDKCSPIPSGTFQIGIVAYDDACSVPLTDTVVVNVSIKMPAAGCSYQQSIHFGPIADVTFGDPAFSLHASASSGLPVTFLSIDTTVVTVSVTEVTISKPGIAIITATQPGNETFNEAEPVEHSFCVNPLPPVLSIEYSEAGITILSNVDAGTLWYKNGVQISSTSRKSLVVQDAAIYMAAASVDNCLSEPSNSIIIVGTEIPIDQQVEIFPNPVHDRLTIFVPGNEKNKYVTLRNVNGRELVQAPLKHDRAVLNMEAFPAGIYLLQIIKGNNTYVRKVLKD
jgi:hypothetical protein